MNDDFLILISNDDSIHSEGLTTLEKHLSPLGEVWTIAPEKEQNAMGRAITLRRPIKVTPLSERRFMVDGTPVDCVCLALQSLLPRKPSLVVSGINKGANLADDLSYSGTVAAAWEGAVHGIPAVSVSLVCRENFRFAPAAKFTARLAEAVLKNRFPAKTILNVNVPDTGGKDIFSYRITSQARSRYDNSISRWSVPKQSEYFFIGGNGPVFEPMAGSDAEAVAQNLISITPVKTDLTDYSSMELFSKWTV